MTKDNIGILCPRCSKIPELPLYCVECDKFYCIECHRLHLLEYLPKFEIPQHIKDRVEKDLALISENNK